MTVDGILLCFNVAGVTAFIPFYTELTPMAVTIPARLKQVLKARAILRSLGDYDTTIVGAIGEIYAEEQLGMVKATRGQMGYDGKIGKRTVSVKAKESDKKGRYVTVSKVNRHSIDDLLIVVLRSDCTFEHYGPVPFVDIEHYFNKKDQVSLSALKRKHKLAPVIFGKRWCTNESV